LWTRRRKKDAENEFSYGFWEIAEMMSQLLGSSSSLRSALPILIDAALKGAFLVLIAAIAAFALRKRSAASRHAVWTAAVIGHLAIPALVLILPAWQMPLLPAAPWIQRQPTSNARANTESANNVGGITSASKASVPIAPAVEAQTAVGTQATESGANSPTTAPVAAAKAVSPASGAAILATIWLVGAALVLLRLAVGTWKVGQLARDGARVEDGVWLSLTQRLANRLGVTRPLILLRGEKLAVPVTWGIVYPAVLLPQDSDNWSEERRRFVLVHEMAHVKRFDALTQLLAQFAVALFWFDPLVWVAAHQMRVEREHACDDYVLRDGTTPSLYAGELLEMVRSIGTPRHDRAAPAFAALAMARRSEFEGRMLAILDPRLDRHTLPRRGTLMTATIVALLTLPLAALRPFQQPVQATAARDEFPQSFRVSLQPSGTVTITGAAATGSAGSAVSATQLANPAKPAGWKDSWTLPKNPTQATAWSCETFRGPSHGSSTHINVSDNSASQIIQYMTAEGDRCAEATVVGPAKFSADETRLAQLSPGGFARFRERTSSVDRAVSVVPVGDGSLSYTAMLDGRTVPFDAAMQTWLAQFLPQVLREASINVPERVARIRAEGGVPAVLKEISAIHSSGAKAAHYEALLKGPPMSAEDAERVTIQAGNELVGSSGDLSSIIQKLPRSSIRSAPARKAIATALSRINSSGDKANTLQVLAPNADPELLLILGEAAEALPSSGDKANFLIATAAEYLTPNNPALRNVYFHAAATLQSSGDMANVLISAMPYGHADPQVAMQVIETSKGLASSGDAANVLIDLASQRVLKPGLEKATVAAIERTLTMGSSGDRANVLISIANANLLTTREIKQAFAKAALALPSDGDRANVLASTARNQ
jgi:beta-lactamase regulating signal transducer with metallopeptidase domain